MCTARDGRWAGRKVCLGKRFQCDNYVQCEDARDEQGCEEEYLRKKIFTRNDRFVCPSPFLDTKTEENETGKFFPMRAIRCCPVIIIIIIRCSFISILKVILIMSKCPMLNSIKIITIINMININIFK